jgi:hypothetical protein
MNAARKEKDGVRLKSIVATETIMAGIMGTIMVEIMEGTTTDIKTRSV